MVLRRQGCCDGHSPRSVPVLPGELKALVRRNALKLGHDRFPYRVGPASIRRWAGFLDEPEWLWDGWKDPRELRVVAHLHHHHGRTKTNLCGKFTPGCRSSYQKSITILGYLVKPEKKSWSLTRLTE